MKRFKRIFALMMVLCLSTVSTTVSFATDTIPAVQSEEEDYMNYDFPEDAVVLYQSEDGVVYQTKELNEARATSDFQFNQKRIEGGLYVSGDFTLTNPHTLIKTTEGVLEMDSAYTNAKANVIVRPGTGTGIFLNKMPLKVSDGYVHFSFKSKVKTVVVDYTIIETKKGYPIFICCGLQ